MTNGVRLSVSADVLVLRRRLRAVLGELSFGSFATTRVLTVASELARNALLHGGGGVANVSWTDDELSLTFVDRGPGIPDLQRALQDGYTTGSGLGMGLGGASRLSDAFHVDGARAGGGTEVVVKFWRS